jgi:hypothetical protein
MTQMATDQTAVDELGSRYQLSAADRCDSCGAQAYIRATLATGQLFFCAHHGAKLKDKLQHHAEKPASSSWVRASRGHMALKDRSRLSAMTRCDAAAY